LIAASTHIGALICDGIGDAGRDYRRKTIC